MAYTKYSLTPASNNAAPPNGAPEGMLPSAVNDTMRDMMAQIRDVGDGIRGGTYTMTAPIITGGSITGVALTGNTFTSPVISGGSINNTPIGATTASTGAFSTLSVTGATTFSGATVANTFSSSGVTITGGTINGTTVGATTAAAGKFTTLEATGVTTVQAGTVSAPAITTTGDTNTGIFFPAADTIAFSEGGTEAMRIDSSGNVGIGTTPALARLNVTTGNDESIFAINSAGASSATMVSYNSADSGDNYFHAFFVDAGASNVGNIDYNRAAGLVRYQTTSDATLKNIIGDSNGQRSLEILNTTRIREYAWKSDVEQKPQIGVIAQELHETYKGAVSVGGENDEGKYRPWGVDKTAFTFHLIAGWQAHEKLIQELKATVDAQATRIAALENPSVES
jgi:hypothetical protein